MKLTFDVRDRTQPDPFIFEDAGQFYLYVTAEDGVEAYQSDTLLGTWQYCGIVTAFENAKTFWAPSVIKLGDTYYMYVSCNKDGHFQHLHVASSTSPLGPFANEKSLYGRFSIDSHMVQTEAGLFLWFAQNDRDCELKGTRIYVDRFLDPYTPEGDPVAVVLPTFDEEKFTPSCNEEGDWYTIEGPFWFRDGEWQYLMYSGGCYLDDTYHIGYAVAKSTDANLKNVRFEKVTDNGHFAPLMIKNEVEEGTGHHSVIFHKGDYYAIYHGRDYTAAPTKEDIERRTARICRMTVSNGVIRMERD